MKNIIIEEIQDFILKKAKELQDNKEMKPEDKLSDADIYLNVYKFLKEYDENVRVLNQHALSKKFRQQSKDYDDDERYNY